MTRIVGSAIALPEHHVTKDVSQDYMRRWLEQHGVNPTKVLEIAGNAGVESRYYCTDSELFFKDRAFGDRNAEYSEAAVVLAEEAVRGAFEATGVDPSQIGLIASVSCTGFMIPSVDAFLANRLELPAHIRRMPITLLGCAAGAMSISHVSDILRAHPEMIAVIVAVELASPSFQVRDLTMAHLVSCALFGDGAAAVVLAGDEAPLPRPEGALSPEVRATRTHFFPDSIRTMGFDVKDTGFHIVLDPSIPHFLDESIWPTIVAFIEDQGRTAEDIAHWLIHPGGRAIMDVLEKRIDRGPASLAVSRKVLRDVGNLSSASILCVLHEHAKQAAAGEVALNEGDLGILVAFGPGFNAEMLLVEWTKG